MEQTRYQSFQKESVRLAESLLFEIPGLAPDFMFLVFLDKEGSTAFSKEEAMQQPIADQTHAYGSIEQHSGDAVAAELFGYKKKSRQADNS